LLSASCVLCQLPSASCILCQLLSASCILCQLLSATYVSVDSLFSTSYFLLSLFFYFSPSCSFGVLNFMCCCCSLTEHAHCICGHCSNMGSTVRA
jgi:hypothetical protein